MMLFYLHLVSFLTCWEPGIVGTRGSSLGHVGEGSQAFVVGDSHLECLAGRVVNHVQTGNVNSVDLSSVANVVDNVNGSVFKTPDDPAS
ncbi:hypothetical protein Tco_0226949 [Tanacetum coccineum]